MSIRYIDDNGDYWINWCNSMYLAGKHIIEPEIIGEYIDEILKRYE